jgi:hypothetical protein
VICLVGYLAALAFTYVFYLPGGLRQKSLGWAGAGVGALVRTSPINVVPRQGEAGGK